MRAAKPISPSSQRKTDAGSVMLVGHNPTMEATLEAMIGEDLLHAAPPSGFPTAGLAVLDHDGSAVNGEDSPAAGRFSLTGQVTATTRDGPLPMAACENPPGRFFFGQPRLPILQP